MLLEKLLKPLRIGKGLLCLFALFVMLLSPQGAWAQTDYGLTVAGVAVTSANASKIEGTNITGSVSYRNDTLTLNNATLNGQVVRTNTDNLTVNFIGTSTVTLSTDADGYVFVGKGGNLILTKTGSVNNALVVNNCLGQTIVSGWGNGSTSIDWGNDGNSMWYLIDTQTSYQVTLFRKTISYNLSVGGVDVTADNASNITGDNITGSVSFTPASDNKKATLTLNGATIAGNVVVNGLTALNIDVIGANTITAGSSSALQSNTATTSCALSFSRADDGHCSLTLSSTDVTVISTGFSSPTYNSLGLVVEGVEDPDYYGEYGLAYYNSDNQSYPAITSAIITSYDTYDIIINGETVTSLNKDKICKGQVGSGHILFDGEHTLTLNKVSNRVFDGTKPFIQTSMDLTINIADTSYFDCGQSVFITRMAGDNDTHTVTFTTDANNPGMLTLQVGDQFNGFDKAFEAGLVWNPKGYYNTSDENGPKAWVAQPILGGQGTKDAPFLINSAADLKQFASLVNEGFITNDSVKLNKNIDCTGLSGLEPIGTDDYPFIGTFIGNDSIISNLSLSSEMPFVGLFGQIGNYDGASGKVSNLTLKNCTFSGTKQACGAVVGKLESGTLIGCKVTGNTTVSGAVEEGNIFVGAIVGMDTNGTLKDNTYEYTVQTSKLVGYNEAEVKNGYTNRALGAMYVAEKKDYVDTLDVEGVLMYTKLVSLPAKTSKGSVIVAEGTYYASVFENDELCILVAPGQKAIINVIPSSNCTVSSFTATNLSTEEEIEDVDATDLKDGDEIYGKQYSFTMPDAEVEVDFAAAFDISSEEYTASIAKATYTGEALVPTTVTLNPKGEDGESIVLTNTDERTDFTLIYKLGEKVVEAPINAGEYTVTITGTGDYTGTTTASYTIEKATITDALLTKPEMIEGLVYDVTAKALVTAGSSPEGTTIKFYCQKMTQEDVDNFMDLNCTGETYTYTKDVPTKTDAGYYAILYIVDGGNNYEDRPASSTIWARIDTAAITSVTISPESMPYTGEHPMVDITVKAGDITLDEEAEEYTVEYQKVNGEDAVPVEAMVAVGNYNVVVTGQGNFKGTKSAPFAIVNRTLAEGEVTFYNHWTTYYSYDGDVELPEGIGAYIIRQSGIGQNTVEVTPIKTIPCNVAVLLNDETTPTDGLTEVTGNMLVHADKDTLVSQINGDVYGLHNGTFMRVSGTIPAGKNYLYLELAQAQQPQAPQLTIVFDGGSTDIKGVKEVREVKDNTFYTLDGRKVEKPSKKGLYISDGHKVVVK